MDYSVRIPATKRRIKILEEKCVSKKKLTPIKDYLFKPTGVDLNKFHPNKVCVRLREFPEDNIASTLDKIISLKKGVGYSDEKESLGKGKTSKLLDGFAEKYEKWGELKTTSTQYLMRINGEKVKIFQQNLFPIGRFLKIEAESETALQHTLKLLKVKKTEIIKKNAAVLLAEKLKLI